MRLMPLKKLEKKIQELQDQHALTWLLCDNAVRIIKEEKDNKEEKSQVKLNIAFAFLKVMGQGTQFDDLMSTDENVKNLIKFEGKYHPSGNRKQNYYTMFKDDKEFMQLLDVFQISSYIFANHPRYTDFDSGYYFRRS
ncbi:MAG TPA: hypothetical protein VD757_00410 [Candidatus Nitrosocosmicus sp.]|nr:hypothetical protein [Candidatus Nitrosocosmicus sp.]